MTAKKTASKPKPVAGIAIMVRPIAKGKLPVGNKKLAGRVSSGNGENNPGSSNLPGGRMT